MPHGFNRKFIIAFSGLALLGVGFAAFVGFSQLRVHPPRGPEPVFELSARPKFLTEELALSCAMEALKKDGLDPAEWRPVPDGRTHAPDGRLDAYMARTAGTPYRGVLLFTRAGRSPKFVSMELQGSRVVCQNGRGR
jgi:hypothetical protein